MADAEQTLRDLLDKILDEKSYTPREIDIQTITSGGANYTSAIFLVNVRSPDRDDLKLFAKVAIIGGKMRKRMYADWLFETERFVYMKLANIYSKIQDNHDIPLEHRYVFPKFYGCNPEYEKESVIMENLVENGYKSYHRFKSIDWEHASVAVKNLAKFHALSFAFAKSDPEEFEKLTANMAFKIGGGEDENLDEAMKPLFMNMIENAVTHVKEDQKDAVRKFLSKMPRFGKYNKPIGQSVIAHGDYKTNNLLFRKQVSSLLLYILLDVPRGFTCINNFTVLLIIVQQIAVIYYQLANDRLRRQTSEVKFAF